MFKYHFYYLHFINYVINILQNNSKTKSVKIYAQKSRLNVLFLPMLRVFLFFIFQNLLTYTTGQF